MRIETLKKANNLIKKIEHTEKILQVLNTAELNEVQKKDIEEEDLITKIAFYTEHFEKNPPTTYLYLTVEEVELLKQALEKHKDKLNSEFCYL